MEYIKICGLKKSEDIKLCAENGATAIGFIYNVPASPRNLEKIEINNLINNLSDEVFSVVVSKPQNVEELKKLMEEVEVNYYQIHSNFKENQLKNLSTELKKKIILALKLNQDNKEEVIKKINDIHNQFFAILIDNSEGHGNTLDVNLVKELLDKTKDAKIILAGGISINNIEDIILKLNPYGIDASSSLESEKGIKDPSKIKELLQKIKEIEKKKRE